MIPLVSIVIPTYNRPQKTVAALESVLAQTVGDIEVIIVNDGSTDETSTTLRNFIRDKRNQLRVDIVDQPNQGQSAARNKGIERAKGTYIAFLDSDDLWEPDKLEWQIRAIEQFRSESQVCFTDVRLVNDSGLDVSGFRAHHRLYEDEIGIDRTATQSLAESFCGFWLSGMLANASLLREIGGFSRDVKFAEDRDLEFRLSLATSFTYVNRLLVRSDRTPSPQGSACRPWDDPQIQFQAQQYMLAKWLRDCTDLSSEVSNLVRRTLGGLYSHEANWHLENARYPDARKSMAEALRYKRTPGVAAKFTLTWLVPHLARGIAPKTRPIGTEGHAS